MKKLLRLLVKTTEEEKEDFGVPAALSRALSSTGEGGLKFGLSDLAVLVAPSSVVVDKTFLEVGNKFLRVLYLESFPPRISPSWLEELWHWPYPAHITTFYSQVSTDAMLRFLRRRLNSVAASLNIALARGEVAVQDLQMQYDDLDDMIRALQSRQTMVFQVGLMVVLQADSLVELNERTQALRQIFERQQATVRIADLRQKEGWVSSIPGSPNLIAASHTLVNVQTQAARYVFSPTSSDITHPGGVWLGFNSSTKSLVIINRFSLPSPHAVVMGKSGYGKSFFVKLEVERSLMKGWPVTVLDPEGEFERLARLVGGEFIELSPSGSTVNVLDFAPLADGESDQLSGKIANVLLFIGSIARRAGLEGLTPEQQQLVSQALFGVYADYGYTQDPRTQTPERLGGFCSSARMPTLSTLAAALQRMLQANPYDAHLQSLLRPIIAALAPYCQGGPYGAIFDRITNVAPASQFVVWNLRQITAQRNEELFGAVMHVVLEYVWATTMNKQQAISGVPRLVCIDEAHVLMRHPESAYFLEQMVRRGRKYGVGCTIITQTPEDFLSSDNPWGRAIFENSSMFVLMRLERKSLQVLQDALQLGKAETGALLTAGKGEGFVIAGPDRVFASFHVASPAEYAAITSDPLDVAQIVAGNRPELPSG